MSSVDSGSGQDFDLNIAPIIDCFTVLITYLLVSASFLSLSVLEVGVAASGVMTPSPPTEQAPPEIPLSLDIHMRKAGSFEIKLSGGRQNLNFTFQEGGIPSLKSKLEELLEQFPVLKEASLSAEPTVHYKEMIAAIEELKKILPKLYIAGT